MREDIEGSNQAFEYVKLMLILTESTWKKKFLSTVMEILLLLLLLFHYHFLYAEKNGNYAGIMLDAPTIALCPKLCRHNVSNLVNLRQQDGRAKKTANPFGLEE